MTYERGEIVEVLINQDRGWEEAEYNYNEGLLTDIHSVRIGDCSYFVSKQNMRPATKKCIIGKKTTGFRQNDKVLFNIYGRKYKGVYVGHIGDGQIGCIVKSLEDVVIDQGQNGLVTCKSGFHFTIFVNVVEHDVPTKLDNPNVAFKSKAK